MAEKSLNKSQKQAVEYHDGPLLIIAGAGTGKTTVITEKIADIVKRGLAKPEEILALAFNENAANEMQERVDQLLDTGYTDVQISTFHGFCQRILEHYGLNIGLPNEFKLVSDTEAWLLMREHLYDFELDYYRPLGNPMKNIHGFLKHFSKCKDELITPQEYLDYAEELKLEKDSASMDEKTRLTEIASAYHRYNQLLLDKNALDFGDLIFYTVKLLQDRENIKKQLQNQYKYILVDEFQDVNYAQYEFVKLLAENSKLTVVGDDDQSVYAFRGASVSNIMRFKDDYPKAKEIVLTENYRSAQEILDSAYELIQNNNPDRLEEKLKIDKKLVSKINSEKNQVQKVQHLCFDKLENEARGVLEKIVEIKEQDKEAVWDDFAILVRANSHVEPFVNALESAKIPYEYIASAGLYRQPIVLDCMSFLRSINNYHEQHGIFRLLKMPFLELRESDLQKITHQKGKKSVTYYEALKRAAQFGVSKEGIAVCDKVIDLLHSGMKDSRYEKTSRALFNFLEKSGYLTYLTHEEDQGNGKVIRQIYQLQQFFGFLDKYESAIGDSNVSHFVEYFNAVIESGDQGIMFQPVDTPDSVNIMTIHKSKGLEYKYVFVVNMVEDRIPSRRRGGDIQIPDQLVREQLPEGDAHIQEERRLFYVAMTRAKKRLFMVSSIDYGGARKKKASRFIGETGVEDSGNQVVGKESGVISEPSKNNQEKSEFVYEIPKAFSFSQVKTYDTCPYKYKLQHILKIPARGSASFSFGNTIHNTLQKFYERVVELNSANQGSLFDSSPKKEKTDQVSVPSLDELLEIYEKSWIGDWYKSKRQREDYFKKGKEILRVFYAAQEGNWTVPVKIESGFKIKVGDYLLRGKIDRIDQNSEGNLDIIDYKTGKSKEKLTADDKEQLLIYQIAAQSLPEYRNIGPVGTLTFWYLNDNIKAEFTGEDKQIEKLRDKLVALIDNIHERDFKAAPSKFSCGYCDYRDICEFGV